MKDENEDLTNKAKLKNMSYKVLGRVSITQNVNQHQIYK